MGKVWITADVLARRLKNGAAGGVVELASNECLTPNAIDLAELRHAAVRRLPAPAMPKARNGKPEAAPVGLAPTSGTGSRSPTKSIGIVLDRPSEVVRGLVDGLYRAGLPLADFTLEDCWIRNTRAMCRAVAAGELAGGIIVRPYAAEAMVLANKVRGVRAVQGTSSAAVSAGLRQFKANVLVVEQSAGTFHQIRGLMRTFAAGNAQINPASPLLGAVEELERS